MRIRHLNDVGLHVNSTWLFADVACHKLINNERRKLPVPFRVSLRLFTKLACTTEFTVCWRLQLFATLFPLLHVSLSEVWRCWELQEIWTYFSDDKLCSQFLARFFLLHFLHVLQIHSKLCFSGCWLVDSVVRANAATVTDYIQVFTGGFRLHISLSSLSPFQYHEHWAFFLNLSN